MCTFFFVNFKLPFLECVTLWISFNGNSKCDRDYVLSSTCLFNQTCFPNYLLLLTSKLWYYFSSKKTIYIFFNQKKVFLIFLTSKIKFHKLHFPFSKYRTRQISLALILSLDYFVRILYISKILFIKIKNLLKLFICPKFLYAPQNRIVILLRLN